MSIKELAKEAIEVQNAWNILDIAKRFSEVVLEVKKNLEEANEDTDTDELRNHPVVRMWASKIHHLVGLDLDAWGFDDAYDECEKIINGETNV